MSGNSLKIPSQVFRWFEKMKNHYDQNIQNVLEKFKTQTEEQQQRLDKSQQNYIDDLKRAHQQQLTQNQQTINDLKNEIEYFKQQLSLQQQSLAQLNTRYDAVMTCLLKEQTKQYNVKDIFAVDDFLTTYEENTIDQEKDIERDNNIEENHDIDKNNKDDTTKKQQAFTSDENKECKENLENMVEQAIEYRQLGATEKAFTLFLQAAQQNNIKAMAALGRAYFLAEGVEENSLQGLIWLIKAAKHNHQAAQKRVDYFQKNEPELYQQAQEALVKS